MDSVNTLLAKAPATARIDLCNLLIIGVAAAMETPEGREAVEKGRQEYLSHLAKLNGKEESE